MAAQSVHEPIRERWNVLFHHVRQSRPVPNIYIEAEPRTIFLRLSRNTLYNIVTVIGSVAPSTANEAIIINVLNMLAVSLLCSAMPRFIISVRELYDRDLRRRWQGIDSGFSVMSQGVSTEMELASGIAFVDVAQEESRTMVGDGDGDNSGAIQLEEVGTSAHKV